MSYHLPGEYGPDDGCADSFLIIAIIAIMLIVLLAFLAVSAHHVSPAQYPGQTIQIIEVQQGEK